ncbi:carboxypeptidase regulatory-like domain-containing protein [Halalkalicoccus sp. GCM10025322]|uniref:carboxypeptidase regulatory-like domain-containing protein n=2 Tax=Halococcaceae TaxID=1963270 RepID=UPI002F966566
MPAKRTLVGVLLSVLVILSAGCAGWGEDGPQDIEVEVNENDEAQAQGDLESEERESTNSEDTDGVANTSATSEAKNTDPASANESAEPENEPIRVDEADTDNSKSPNESDSNDVNESEESETHHLTVTVTSPEGHAVDNADVSIVTYDGGADVADATTAGNGQATFDVKEGAYEVLVSHDQFDQSPANRIVMVDEDTDFEARLENPGGMYEYSMTIQVVDQDGNPISNELVRIGTPGENHENYLTDENGEVTINFQNSAETDAIQKTIEVRGQEHSAHITMGEQRKQIIAQGERETHQLKVHTGEENPVEGIDVTIERWDGTTTTKTTNEEGTASFEVYPGEYTITSEYNGDTHTETVAVENDSSVLLPFERPLRKLRYP